MATAAAKGPKEFTFVWEGKDKSGKSVRGEFRATGDAVVRATLRRQGVMGTTRHDMPGHDMARHSAAPRSALNGTGPHCHGTACHGTARRGLGPSFFQPGQCHEAAGSGAW